MTRRNITYDDARSVLDDGLHNYRYTMSLSRLRFRILDLDISVAEKQYLLSSTVDKNFLRLIETVEDTVCICFDV
jgi:hypothetical protein